MKIIRKIIFNFSIQAQWSQFELWFLGFGHRSKIIQYSLKNKGRMSDKNFIDMKSIDNIASIRAD